MRDRDTLQQGTAIRRPAIYVLSTLHANNSYHALNRIINFFPYDAPRARALAVCLKAVISQRLVKAVDAASGGGSKVCKHIATSSSKARWTERSHREEFITGFVSFEQALLVCRKARSRRTRRCETPTRPLNLAWLMNNAEQKAQAATSVSQGTI